MNESWPFDRAVDYYDQTRLLPEPVATDGIRALLEELQTHPGAQILEVGTGTGRIGLPLRARGANLVGCDLSMPMLRRQHAKEPAARIIQADALRLPFGAGQFDSALTIHVLHLVAEWRAALAEIRRVLRPGGVYVNSKNWHAPSDVDARLRDYWRRRAEAHGARWRRPGAESREEVVEAAEALGARVSERVAAVFTLPVAPADVLDSLARRMTSDTWSVPDDVLEVTVKETRAWAEAELGDLSRPRHDERRFVLDVFRF